MRQQDWAPRGAAAPATAGTEYGEQHRVQSLVQAWDQPRQYYRPAGYAAVVPLPERLVAGSPADMRGPRAFLTAQDWANHKYAAQQGPYLWNGAQLFPAMYTGTLTGQEAWQHNAQQIPQDSMTRWESGQAVPRIFSRLSRSEAALGPAATPEQQPRVQGSSGVKRRAALVDADDAPWQSPQRLEHWPKAGSKRSSGQPGNASMVSGKHEEGEVDQHVGGGSSGKRPRMDRGSVQTRPSLVPIPLPAINAQRAALLHQVHPHPALSSAPGVPV